MQIFLDEVDDMLRDTNKFRLTPVIVKEGSWDRVRIRQTYTTVHYPKNNMFLQRTERGFQCTNSLLVTLTNTWF